MNFMLINNQLLAETAFYKLLFFSFFSFFLLFEVLIAICLFMFGHVSEKEL